MAKKVAVTGAQRRAAQTIVERSAVTGRYVRPGVAKIAEASTHSKSGGQWASASKRSKSPKTAAASVLSQTTKKK